MPTYLCHGFRWDRQNIRVHVVLENLDDAAPEWTIRQGSAKALIESFYKLYNFLPACTFPPNVSGNTAPPQPYYVSRSLDPGKDDDDAASYQTSHSSGSRSRSRSVTGLNQQQPSSYLVDRGEQDPSASRKDGSSSGRRRSKSEISRNNIPLNPRVPSSQQRMPAGSYANEAPTDPVLAQDWSPVKLLEEYDPANLEEVSRPYAYIADYVKRIDASCGIVEEIQRYELQVRYSPVPPITGSSSDEMLNEDRDTSELGRDAGWFEQLRDKLQQNSKIKWYVVVMGDEERVYPIERAGADFRPLPVQQKTPKQLNLNGPDNSRDMRREQLRAELRYEYGGVDMLVDRTPDRGPKPPEKELPPLRTDVPINQAASPVNQAASPRANTPKTPGKGGLRRLFSRSKTDEELRI